MKSLYVTLALSAIISTNALAQKHKVALKTSMGDIEFMLYDNTPKHRDNMVKLIKQKFYDGTLFHRVIPQFMIQGGDPDSKNAPSGKPLGSGDLGYRVDAEFNDANYHKYGALAAARDGNPAKASSASQFYFVVGKKYSAAELDGIAKSNGRNYTQEQKNVYETQGGTPFLDNGYTVFGEVTKGMDVVEKIVAVPRNNMDRPNEDVVMLSMKLKKKKKFLIF